MLTVDHYQSTNSLLSMNRNITRTSILLFSTALGAFSVQGQANPPQDGAELLNTTNGYLNQMNILSLRLTDFDPGFNTEGAQSGCDNTFLYSTLFANNFNEQPADPSGIDPADWASLPTADGTAAFTLEINYRVIASSNVIRATPTEWRLWIDDVECVGCTEILSSTEMWCSGQSSVQHVRIEHELANAWSSPADGKQKYTLRPVMRTPGSGGLPAGVDAYNCTNVCCAPEVFGVCVCGFDEIGWQDHSASVITGQVPEIRFMAVMVGSIHSGVLGEFDTPQVPVTILRTPPGDLSSSFYNTTTTNCFGTNMFVSDGSGSNVWAQASAGFDLDYFSVEAEGGVSITTDYEQTTSGHWETCVESTVGYETQTGNLPDDIFIGNSLHYIYGYATTIKRDPVTCAVIKDAGFVMAPTEENSSYNYTESYIRETEIPELEATIAATPPGDAYDALVMQLDVWQQALDLNDSIKATAQPADLKQFNGGAAVETEYLTASTTETRSIDWSFNYEEETSWSLTEEVELWVFGGSVAVGGSVQLRTSYGRGEEESTVHTNTSGYKLGDDDTSDRFKVLVKEDPVFGTYVFAIHPDNYTRSSCPYEGGYQLDQPSLGVQDFDQTTMVLNNVLVGTSAVFPLYICNDSFFDRTYHLKYDATTNTEGGLLQVFGNPLTNDEGVELIVPSSSCLNVTNLLLTEPASPASPDYEIELYLYSLCEPEIRSTITVEAHFDMNVGIDGSGISSEDWFTVRPNPSNGQFQLLPTGLSGPVSVMVTDATGRTVKAPFLVAGSGMVTLDMGDVAPGMYHLIASSAGEQRSVKLVVQR